MNRPLFAGRIGNSLGARRSPAAAAAARVAAVLWLGCAAGAPALAARAVTLPTVPLFIRAPVNPNVLLMLDNSQSMDATMAGKVISGSDPGTRSNVARNALRSVLATYRYSFNWGLGSFAVSGTPALYTTYPYFLGTASTMVYTNTCNSIVDGVGVSDRIGTYAKVVAGVKTDVTGPLPCIVNPQPGSSGGYAYITYSRSSDDADVNDVLYSGDFGPQAYGVGTSGTNYRLFSNRLNPTGWAAGDFTGCVFTCGAISFTPTDAGWLPTAEEFPRQIFTKRGWGYLNNPTGLGQVLENVVNSDGSTSAEVSAEAAHYARLIALLGPEDNSPTSPSLKNSAVFTPLAGTLETSRKYFEGSSGYTSPIVGSCQTNYVVLATDGNPTGKKNGSQYTPSQWVNTKDPVTGVWTYGPAINDVLTEITALRSTSYSGKPYDVRTYVVGLGDSVQNESSVAALDEMARRGGTTKAFLASSSTDLAAAFDSIVTSIKTESGAASSLALSASSYTAGTRAYQATFNPSTWTGDLLARTVNADGSIGATPVWKASTEVSAQDWNTGRAVLTLKGSSRTGVPFRSPAAPAAPTAAEIDASQYTLLNTDPRTGSTDGLAALRVAFLRGDTRYEKRKASATAAFRDRLLTAAAPFVSNVLGDIVDSAPFYVGAPTAGYSARFETASYPAFARTWAGRTPYLYVGANDGMLHAFDAATGREKFAYVPNLVFPSLAALTVPEPLFNHRFTVDGSPVVNDVHYAGAWHTLLVSGLRGGGRGLFALDVTDPSKFTEATASSVVRWEFSDAALGHVFARPLVLKTKNGRWSVITGNGYNASGSSTAQLFVVDAETGNLTRRIDTGAGTSASPNGLSAATAVDSDEDGIADLVYAGDLNGNLWKFDLSDANPSAWKVGAGTAALFAAGAAKPITAAPDVTRHPMGGNMVTFASGRYLDSPDIGDTAVQTAYGIWDKTDVAVTAAQVLAQKIDSTAITAAGKAYRISTHRVGTPLDASMADDLSGAMTRSAFLSSMRGWSLDLPAAGERVIADVAIRGGRAVFASMIPKVVDCEPVGTGWITEVDVLTGNRLDAGAFDTNRDGKLDAFDRIPAPPGVPPPPGATIATVVATSWEVTGGMPMATSSVSYKVDSTTGTRTAVPTSVGTIEEMGGPGRAGSQQRTMWRVVE